MKTQRKLWIVGVAAALLMAMTGCGETTVKLDKYVTIDAEGYDSMGVVNCSFDTAAFEKDYAGKIKVSKGNNLISGYGMLSGESAEELLMDVCVNWSLDKTTGLKNGDAITMKWNCEDTLAKQCFNVKLEYSDIMYTVSGLTEVEKFDPFEYLEVSFSGTSPMGEVTLKPNYDKPEIQYIDFTAGRYYGLANGDQVIVTASIYGTNDDFVEKFGVVPSETQKTYTCESLPYYISDVNEIPQDLMDKLVAQGENLYKDYVADVWAKPENLLSMELAGNYFLSPKTGSGYNFLYLIYEIKALNPDPAEEVTFYYYIGYEGMMILEDGTCYVDRDYYSAPSTSWLSTETFNVGNYTYVGYDNLDVLVDKLVISNVDVYQYTTTMK